MKRWIYIGLFVSLALNLFLAGVIGAHVFWQRGHHPHRGPFNIRHAYSVLKPADQTKAKAIWAANRQAFFEKIKEIRKARRAVRQLLQDDATDYKKVEAAITNVSNKRHEIHKLVRGVVQKIAASLPATERMKFYRAALKRHRRFRHRRGERRHRERQGER
jgi:uncharacterized membrane protein